MNSQLRDAILWHGLGYTPLPVAPDGSKRPAVMSWTAYQSTRPSLTETIDLFAADHDGLGVLTGTTSGGLEMLEAEGIAVAEGFITRLAQAFADHDRADLWQTVSGGYCENTPGGGLHWYYRVSGGMARKNTKLARRPATEVELAANPGNKVRVLIETRGEGGFSVIAPSNGRTHASQKAWTVLAGSPATIPTISVEDRDFLYVMAQTLDQMPAVTEPPRALTAVGSGIRPGDDYNSRTSWGDILVPQGWVMVAHYGGNLYGWQRPGKRSRGISATSGRNDADCLYVFSTSTEFETEQPYTKFAAYALLNHGGDYSSAAKELRALGYGEPATVKRLHTSARTPDFDTPEEPPELENDFWTRRPILTHLRDFAYARMCSPQAILGVTILRVLHTIPPNVVLPPIIGGHGSLNLFVALVGSSGSGKGAAENASADSISGMGEIYTASTGSGEGIAHQYAHREKQGLVYDRDAVLFTVPEVDTITAIGSRQGSTLLSQMRSAFSGERLGYSYADATRRIPINRHTYRLSMIVGVQPEKAGPLLHDADGGTPQRFIWLMATDPAITSQPPEMPEPWPITLPKWNQLTFDLSTSFRTLTIPDQVTKELREAHAERARGEGTALDGHAMFAREKVAVAFAALDCRVEMNMEDWELAGTVMRFSDLTRARIEQTLKGIEAGKRDAQTELLVDRHVQTEQRMWGLKVERVADLVAKRLVELGGDAAPGAIRRRVSSSDRDAFEEALSCLVEQGHVTVESEPSRRVRVVGK